MSESSNMKIGSHCILACLYFLLLPTTIAINSAGNSFLKLATIPIAAYFLITIIFSKKELQFNAVHLLLCLFTFSTLITFLIDTSFIKTVIGYFLNAALYICLTAVRYNKKELSLLENTQVLLLCIIVALILFSDGSFFDRTTLVIFGQKSDPNYLVAFFLFPMSIVLKKIMHSKYRLAYALLLFLSIYCVFLSGSRGGLISVIALFMAFALIYPSNIKNKIIFLLGGCGILFCAWFILAPYLPENIVERMSIQQVVDSGGSGRWYIWKSMLEEIVNSPDELLLGRGFGGLHGLFMSGKWAYAVAHNEFIQVLYDQGVIGLVAFALLTIGCLLRCIRERKTVAIAVIGMMAIGLSLSFDPTTRAFWNLVAYAALNFSENEHFTSTKTLKVSEED